MLILKSSSFKVGSKTLRRGTIHCILQRAVKQRCSLRREQLVSFREAFQVKDVQNHGSPRHGKELLL